MGGCWAGWEDVSVLRMGGGGQGCRTDLGQIGNLFLGSFGPSEQSGVCFLSSGFPEKNWVSKLRVK